MRTFTDEITLTIIDCGKCGGSYALNERYRQQCEENGTSWTCPYCKAGWGYMNNGTLDRLKKELSAAKCETLRQQQFREAAERARSEVERKLKRVHYGTCPCCRRSFRNLARHMATKHGVKNKGLDITE